MTKTVMIIDDSTVSRMMIRGIINELRPNWEILEANNGETAIEQCREQAIDFFSVDLTMPGLNGIDSITELKKTHPDGKYSLLTANYQEATINRASNIGAACISKPISEHSIQKMLNYFEQ